MNLSNPQLSIYQVDAFTSQPFQGNPAAVCLLDQPRPDDWMQAIASEMNLSETAFLLPEGDGWRLRWFTPAVEVDLCGHATLASAHVLFQTGRLAAGGMAHFYTRSGLLTARQAGSWIEMDFPAKPAQEAHLPEGILKAMRVEPVFTALSQFDALLEVGSETEVRAARPDFTLLREIPVRGVILTSQASGEYDFISRFFAPRVGVNEDPVTGSAHSVLAPYWAARLNKRDLLAYQASARGGELRLHLEGDRVQIAGQAVMVLVGKLTGM